MLYTFIISEHDFC